MTMLATSFQASDIVLVVIIVVLLGLSGVDRTVLLLIGSAPLVFSVVTFASLENLDVGLATSALSPAEQIETSVLPGEDLRPRRRTSASSQSCA